MECSKSKKMSLNSTSLSVETIKLLKYALTFISRWSMFAVLPYTIGQADCKFKLYTEKWLYYYKIFFMAMQNDIIHRQNNEISELSSIYRFDANTPDSSENSNLLFLLL